MNLTFLGSSMVEHSAVNRTVVGSSPTPGANFKRVFSLMVEQSAPTRLVWVRLLQGVPFLEGWQSPA